MVAKNFATTSYYSSFVIANLGRNCSLSNAVYNAVFSAYNAAGFAGYVVASENLVTLSVEGVSMQMHNHKLDLCPSTGADTSCVTHIWSGHEAENFHLGSDYNYHPNQITAVYGNLWQPNLSYPSTGCADYETCNEAMWIGLEDQQGGYPDHNLAQAGVDGYCQLSGCSDSYVMRGVYDMTPNFAVECNGSPGSSIQNMGILPGDEVSVEVYQSNGYNFWLYDWRTGIECVSYNNSYGMTTPTIAAFMLENFYDCGGIDCDSLAQFAYATFTGLQWYDTTLGYWVYLNQAQYLWDDNMLNCAGATNVAPGGIDPSLGGSGFGENWITSAGTPWWCVGYPNCTPPC